MQNNKKNKFKFNFFDVMVIIVIALFIVASAYIFFLGNENTSYKSNGDVIEYKLEIEMADEIFSDLIKKGDIVVENENGLNVGQVIKVEISDYDKVIHKDEIGNLVVGGIEGYVNIVLTIECNGQREGTTALITNGCRLRVGGETMYHTPKFTFTATCIEIIE